ncbi:hypothetical protein D047_2013B, partial [Vibrio parahaemolyticus VPTS-2010_2]
PDTALRSSV